ncbi:nucleotide disphospho-sugar-binding domain-containing protein [Streptomyces sp. CRN 30]|uniref:nucleotide disphospho-sugar-binding domain-containing protein n=1 Tax=Streptomyces sp. CRN 30 TaxID=3075613 RepID=UPI002A80D255|nr:nucleotide disphospho-sugar-binding domain-containing protein [Streptomyces sp. CRN 30]
MRVLFVIFPATAHVHPVVPLAWALRAAGHDVRVATHAGIAETVGAAGLTTVPVGDTEPLRHVVELSRNPDLLEELDAGLTLDTDHAGDWEDTWLRTVRSLSVFGHALDDLVAVCRAWQPDLVVWDPFCVPAAIAARLTGAAHVRCLWGQDNIAWLRARARERAGHSGPDEILARLMEPLLEPYGLDYDDELLLGQWTIDPGLAGLRLSTGLPTLPMRPLPYHGSATPPHWLDEPTTRPRVCLTLGVGGRGRQLLTRTGVSLADAVTELSALDIELVVTLDPARWPATAALPDNVRLVGYVPLDLVLPSCTAVVHHGGTGTFHAAVACRVLQLIVPMPFWEEPTNARHLRERGAGETLDPEVFSAAALREHLARLLREPRFRDGVRQLHEEYLGVPTPHDLVPELESLTRARHDHGTPTNVA